MINQGGIRCLYTFFIAAILGEKLHVFLQFNVNMTTVKNITDQLSTGLKNKD